jgi:hypothetical protein
LFPTIAEVGKFFLDKARDIQAGGAEHCSSEQWLNIWWSADEYILIKLVVENKIKDFYEESKVLLSIFLNSQSKKTSTLIYESILLNKILLKQPF